MDNKPVQDNAYLKDVWHILNTDKDSLNALRRCMKTENKRSDCETEAVMELLKKNIHMSKLKGKLVTQSTLDEDFNVPDTKPDISPKMQLPRHN